MSVFYKMDVMYEDDTLALIEKIPEAPSYLDCVNIRCGVKLIATLGIFLGFTCAAMLLVKDRKNMTTTTVILVVFLSIFIIVTILFVLASVLLLMAALDVSNILMYNSHGGRTDSGDAMRKENLDLMSYYIWLSVVYLCIQLVLAIIIPLVLIVEGRYPISVALIWMAIVLIVGLGWTHFISMVSSYRMSLLSIDEY
ncbi:uncharacterized protein LOC110380287 isoform X1 [Helicoverpa armigera]|uniref:uncharacterized protein LOC124634725 n=1 Tax=Helicoverpa zea TaxID=7113 RepID=UPI000B39EBB3|nr:uncharacterized protein LOC110380287 isoform X1 [Helicoverpa armigera]XP_047026342.1 uncharacterized protein LOC124634725 [Helicoverpa zea]PZC86036.1 hypothetical protein B5X24_HaOG212994 [Helicoverpa armigera]